MEINHLLEKAKELLIKDKNLTPVLFVDTKKGLFIIGLNIDFNKVNKRKMMMDIGIKVAQKGEELISISFVSDSYISKINLNNQKLFEKTEAITISKLTISNNKKEVLTQEYERLNDEIIFKGVSQKIDHSEIFILDAFVYGYDTYRKRNIAKYN